MTKWTPAAEGVAHAAANVWPWGTSDARTGVSPSGPELRPRRTQVPLPGRPGLTVAGSLCVAERGFSLHAIHMYPISGSVWVPFGLNAGQAASVSAIRRTDENPPVFWAATSSGVYRRNPTTLVWELKLWGINYVFNDLAIQPDCPGRIYAASGFLQDRQRHRGGIFVSHDDGGGWESITAGAALHNGPITDVEIDPIDFRYVYAATFGHGVWTYTWPQGDVPSCW